jgi:hypothetical protein
VLELRKTKNMIIDFLFMVAAKASKKKEEIKIAGH